MSIKLTDNMKGLIDHAAKSKGITKKSIADACGLSKAWATSLTRPASNGGLRSLSDNQTAILSDLLDLEFVELLESNRPTESALQLSELAKDSPLLNSLMNSLNLYACACEKCKAEGLTDQELITLGEKLIRIAEKEKACPKTCAQKILDSVRMN